MPKAHLTEITVRALKGSAKNPTTWDSTTPGFGIRCGLRTKTWTVMRGRTRERLSIGSYPDLSVAEARAEAKRLLSTAPEPKILSLTFEDARGRFIEENYRDAKPRTKAEAERLLKKHFKGLDHRQLHSIDDADVKRELDKLSDTPSEQLHVFRTARCFFRWCVRPPRRYIKHSPMEGYEPPSSDKRGTRILSDDELKAVWKAAEKPPHAIIRLLILWGTRNTETIVTERKWASDAVLTIPGEHTKNGRDHSIPMRAAWSPRSTPICRRRSRWPRATASPCFRFTVPKAVPSPAGGSRSSLSRLNAWRSVANSTKWPPSSTRVRQTREKSRRFGHGSNAPKTAWS